jgi:DNA-binding GntR family transcriptional regulator
LNSPATQKTVKKLLDLIRSQTGAGQTRLPPVKSLSFRFGVSMPIICKAIKILRNRGLISAGPRAGIRICAPVKSSDLLMQETVPMQSDQRTAHWQQLSQRIGEDIFDGMYPPGILMPSVKEMMQHYGACFKTMKRALTALVKEKRLVPYKKGFRVFQHQERHYRPLLVVVVGHQDITASFSAFDSGDTWRTLE